MGFGTSPKGKSAWMIPKSDDPGPGSYNTPEAIQNQQWAKIHGTTKKNAKPLCFTDRHRNMLKHVPGPGHNKMANVGKDKISKDPNLTVKRH